MSLASTELLEDETIRARLFVALNGFPIFAHLKATTLHLAKQVSKDRAPLSNVIVPCCVVGAFAGHRGIHQRKICLQNFEECKRNKRLPFSERNWLRGLDLNQRSRLRGGIKSLTSVALL